MYYSKDVQTTVTSFEAEEMALVEEQERIAEAIAAATTASTLTVAAASEPLNGDVPSVESIREDDINDSISKSIGLLSCVFHFHEHTHNSYYAYIITVAIVLEESEKNAILNSEQFLDFFDHSTRLIERALSTKYDILTDYRIGDEEPVYVYIDITEYIRSSSLYNNICNCFM